MNTGQAAISWADLIIIAAKVATALEWSAIKNKRNPAPEGGRSIADLFGAEWNLQLGREDATQPDPEVPIPSVNSSVDQIRVCVILGQQSVPPYVSKHRCVNCCLKCPNKHLHHAQSCRTSSARLETLLCHPMELVDTLAFRLTHMWVGSEHLGVHRQAQVEAGKDRQ